MKKSAICIFLSLVMLSGCANSAGSSSAGDSQAADSSSSSAVTKTQKDNTSKPSALPFEQTVDSPVMPVLQIVTEKDGDDAADFITEPVAEHVSKEKAKWTPGYKKPPAPYYEACSITLDDKDGTRLIDGASAQVKVRGNWTTAYDKKPLRIKFDEKQSVLSLGGGEKQKNWLLLAEYKDGSMLRNRSALSISDELLAVDGIYAADSQLVEVMVNGEYFGVYLLCEYNQVNKNKIDIAKPDEGYEGTDIGYFLEYDGYYYTEDELHGFKIYYNKDAALTPYNGKGTGSITPLAGGSNSVGMSIKSDVYSKEQHDFIKSYVDKVYNIMYYAAYENKAYVFNDDFSEISETSAITPQQAVEKVVNLDSLADMYIISELTCDADIYWSSFFMYADFGGGGDTRLTFGCPWDFDSAMGNKNRCASAEGFYAANSLYDVNDNYRCVNPWLAVLMYCDWYTDIIRDKWTNAYDDGVFTRGIDLIDKETQDYAAAFDRNYDKWDNIIHNEAAGELCAASKACKTQQQAAEYLAGWLTKRVSFMNENWHK